VTKTDEQVLREIIRQEDEKPPKRTEDFIFASGLVPRPIVGRKEVEAMEQSRTQEAAKSRANQRTKTEMRRLVVAQSGDLAYDFGDVTFSYDAPDGKRVSFNSSYLRAWRKVRGEWMVDAVFFRRNEPEGKTNQR
jgi:ketosteroid isomerase-like protein